MQLDRYRVVQWIARGAMGEIWKVFDPELNDHVAIKVLPPELAGNTVELERVTNTFRQVRKLSHANICPVYDLKHAKPVGAFLVMKFVEGVTLLEYAAAYRRDHGTFPLSEVVRVLRPIAAALDYAHARQVLHRDIKPQNIMIETRGRDPQLIDFGLAAEIQTSIVRISTREQASEVSGTLQYLAPEQWRGLPPSQWTDQYSLAAMAYELVTGRAPFEANNAQVLRLCVLNEPIEAVAGVSMPTNAAFAKGLAKSRDQRFATCVEFIDAIDPTFAATGPRTALAEAGLRATGTLWQRVRPRMVKGVESASTLGKSALNASDGARNRAGEWLTIQWRRIQPRVRSGIDTVRKTNRSALDASAGPRQRAWTWTANAATKTRECIGRYAPVWLQQPRAYLPLAGVFLLAFVYWLSRDSAPEVKSNPLVNNTTIVDTHGNSEQKKDATPVVVATEDKKEQPKDTPVVTPVPVNNDPEKDHKDALAAKDHAHAMRMAAMNAAARSGADADIKERFAVADGHFTRGDAALDAKEYKQASAHFQSSRTSFEALRNGIEAKIKAIQERDLAKETYQTTVRNFGVSVLDDHGGDDWKKAAALAKAADAESDPGVAKEKYAAAAGLVREFGPRALAARTLAADRTLAKTFYEAKLKSIEPKDLDELGGMEWKAIRATADAADRETDPKIAAAEFAKATKKLQEFEPVIKIRRATVRHEKGDSAGALAMLRGLDSTAGQSAAAQDLYGKIIGSGPAFWLQRSEAELKSLTDPRQYVAAGVALAEVYYRVGNKTAYADLVEKLRAQAQNVAAGDDAATAYWNIGEMQLDVGDYDGAIRSYQNAERLAETLNEPSERIRNLATFAGRLALCGEAKLGVPPKGIAFPKKGTKKIDGINEDTWARLEVVFQHCYARSTGTTAAIAPLRALYRDDYYSQPYSGLALAHALAAFADADNKNDAGYEQNFIKALAYDGIVRNREIYDGWLANDVRGRLAIASARLGHYDRAMILAINCPSAFFKARAILETLRHQCEQGVLAFDRDTIWSPSDLTGDPKCYRWLAERDARWKKNPFSDVVRWAESLKSDSARVCAYAGIASSFGKGWVVPPPLLSPPAVVDPDTFARLKELAPTDQHRRILALSAKLLDDSRTDAPPDNNVIGRTTRGMLFANDTADPIGQRPARIVPVNLVANRAVQIDLSSNDFDAYLRLLDSADKVVASDDDGGEGLNARIVFTPPRSGTYRIIATTYSGGVGAYVLAVKDLGPAAGAPVALPKPPANAELVPQRPEIVKIFDAHANRLPDWWLKKSAAELERSTDALAAAGNWTMLAGVYDAQGDATSAAAALRKADKSILAAWHQLRELRLPLAARNDGERDQTLARLDNQTRRGMAEATQIHAILTQMKAIAERHSKRGDAAKAREAILTMAACAEALPRDSYTSHRAADDPSGWFMVLSGLSRNLGHQENDVAFAWAAHVYLHLPLRGTDDYGNSSYLESIHSFVAEDRTRAAALAKRLDQIAKQRSDETVSYMAAVASSYAAILAARNDDGDAYQTFGALFLNQFNRPSYAARKSSILLLAEGESRRGLFAALESKLAKSEPSRFEVDAARSFMALFQAKRGQSDDAKKTLMQISNPAFRAAGYEELAAKEAASRPEQLSAVIDWIATIDDPADRAAAYIGVGRALNAASKTTK